MWIQRILALTDEERGYLMGRGVVQLVVTIVLICMAIGAFSRFLQRRRLDKMIRRSEEEDRRRSENRGRPI